MQKRSDSLLRAIATLGRDALQYEKRHEVNRKSEYFSEPVKALEYFLVRMFYRGRFDWLSEVYAQAALQRVKNFIEHAGWQGLDRLDEEQDPIGLEALKPKDYKFPDADKKMVYDALKVVSGFPDKNVIRYAKQCIEEGKVEDIYKKITSVRYVKDKLACLFLRDVASLYDLIEAISVNKVGYFLPVDTWVKQFCEKLHITKSRKVNEKAVKEAIIRECHKLDPPVQPIYFDHGLWVLSQIPYTMRNLPLIKRSINSLRTIRDSGML